MFHAIKQLSWKSDESQQFREERQLSHKLFIKHPVVQTGHANRMGGARYFQLSIGLSLPCLLWHPFLGGRDIVNNSYSLQCNMRLQYIVLQVGCAVHADFIIAGTSFGLSELLKTRALQ